jgi:pimeloyl-ACP methyl ester carboxylesterase
MVRRSTRRRGPRPPPHRCATAALDQRFRVRCVRCRVRAQWIQRPAQPLPQRRPHWEDLAAFDGATITQPAIYIAGELDTSTAWLSDAIAQQAASLPALSGTHLLQGCGHWVEQERPDQVNDLILHWLHHPTG